jgi:hypothetical protein
MSQNTPETRKPCGAVIDPDMVLIWLFMPIGVYGNHRP